MIKDNTTEGQPGHEMALMAPIHDVYHTIKSLLKLLKSNFATKRLKELSDY